MMDDKKTPDDETLVAGEDDREEKGEVGDSKIADALSLIEEMAASGQLHARIVPMSGYNTHLSFDPAEHPELANEKMGEPIVIILGGIITGLPKPEDERKTEDNRPHSISEHKVEGTFYEVAVVHGKRGKEFQDKVGKTIGELMREKKAGTGPHSGPNGPLVKSNKQIQAIAYSKTRRGE